MAEENPQQKLAIVGGGITGLSAAYYALKQGVPGGSIDIYEATNRVGGKIESAMLDGKIVNKGAEFLDSEHTELLQLCRELGVGLTESKDQGAFVFRRRNGSRMEEKQFFKAYQPVTEQLACHKAALAAEPNGRLAQQLNAMSLDQYLATLGNSLPARTNRNFFQKLWGALTLQPNRINPEVLDIARTAYASEAGQASSNISALQFVHEASAEPGSIMASDCAYRVKGGTEQIITALRAKLEEAGVRIHPNKEVKSISKQDGKVQFTFADGSTTQAQKAIMALPSYGLVKVQGLDALGLSPEAAQLIGGTQYTDNLKFTMKLKDGLKADKSNFYADGFQCWSAEPDQVTFLCNATALKQMSTPQFMAKCMEDYARANGTSADAMFDKGPGKIVLTSPGKNPCYASPAPGQVLALDKLGQSMDTLNGNGIAIAGTFLPHHTKGGLEIGFMNCGVNSAQLAVDHVLDESPQQVKWAERVRAQQVAKAVANENAARLGA